MHSFKAENWEAASAEALCSRQAGRHPHLTGVHHHCQDLLLRQLASIAEDRGQEAPAYSSPSHTFVDNKTVHHSITIER